MKKILVLACMALPLLASALSIEEAEKFVPANQNGARVLSLSFDEDEPSGKNFYLSNEAGPAEGCNGTAGVKIVRTDPKKYTISTCRLGVLPFAEYEVTLSMKGENLKRVTTPKGWFGAIGFEFYENGQWISGKYLQLNDEDIPGEKWRNYSFHFKTPSATCETIMSLYLVKGSVGTLWADDIVVTGRTHVTLPVLIRPAMGLTVWGNRADIVFQKPVGFTPEMAALITLNDKKQLARSGEDGKIRATFKDMAYGPAKLSISILDPAKKEKILEEKYSLTIRPEEKAPANAAVLDRFGRLIVDGKPFMPLGMFGYPSEIELSALKSSSFNCVMSYSAICGKDNRRTLKSIREQMDEYQACGLKVIFSVKDQILRAHLDRMDNVQGTENVTEYVVRNIKDHPALIAWYTTDELELSRIAEAVKLRNTVSRNDPWHPTWSITYRPNDMPDYAVSGDITGMDPYPIYAEPGHYSIRTVKTFSDLCADTGLPFWMIPQAFAWSNTLGAHEVEKFKKSHIPTQDELDAMPLLCAISGARGFVFYGTHYILIRPEKILPGAGKEQWNRICKTAELLKWMEPYIMCEKGAVPIRIKADKPDQLYGAFFEIKKGDARVILSGVDTPASGEFTIEGYPNMKSKLGRTENLGGGKYRFTANGVQADILY